MRSELLASHMTIMQLPTQNTAPMMVTKEIIAKVMVTALVPRQRLLEISVFQIAENEYEDDQRFQPDQ